MRDLPLDVAKEIYKKQYWTAPRFDQVNAISSAVAEELKDFKDKFEYLQLIPI